MHKTHTIAGWGQSPVFPVFARSRRRPGRVGSRKTGDCPHFAMALLGIVVLLAASCTAAQLPDADGEAAVPPASSSDKGLQPLISSEELDRMLAESKPVRVLILSGLNNHDWRATTPVLKTMFENCDRFSPVDVTEKPAELTAELLAKYDVLVSNWTPFPDTARLWPPETERVFLDFVNNGGGFVVVHAASCTFPTWPEFQRLIALTWQADHTSHTQYHTFKVSMRPGEHPITRGMPDFYTTDELYQNMVQVIPQELRVLCTAFAAPDKNGTGRDEPMLVWTEMGKGRGVNLVLGHDVPAMENLGFRTLLLRATEWAATGDVTIPIPDGWPSAAEAAAVSRRRLRWQQTDSSLALLNYDRIVWQFNYGKDQPKPCFHPVTLLDGMALTWLSPPDHPWHRSVWFSWKTLNGVNYWEEDPKTGASQGVTEVVKAQVTPKDDYSALIEMTLSYHPVDQPAVLTEQRTIHVSAPDAAGRYRMDWKGVFTTGEQDVLMQGGTAGGGYAGMSVRIASDTRDWRLVDSEGREDTATDGFAKNTHGQSARWMDFSFVDKTTGQPAGVAILEAPDSFRHPSSWHNLIAESTSFGYFSPAPLWSEPYTLRAGESLLVRYRIVVHPGGTDRKLLENEWRGMGGEEEEEEEKEYE